MGKPQLFLCLIFMASKFSHEKAIAGIIIKEVKYHVQNDNQSTDIF